MVTVNSSEFGLTGGILCLLRQENLLFSFFPAECTKVRKYCFGQTEKCWVKGTRLRYFFCNADYFCVEAWWLQS